jgi:hypothetical protein
VAEVSLKNGVVPEMVKIPRLATGGTVNIQVEPHFQAMVKRPL